MKIIASLIIVLAALNASAINWLLYPTTNSVGSADTFMVGTLTTNWQVTGTALLNWTRTNVVYQGGVASASNSVPGGPLWTSLVDFTNKMNANSNLLITVSNKVVAATNNSAIVRTDNSTFTHVVINNNTVDQPPQVIGGSVVVVSNLTANGYTYFTSNSAPRIAFSNVLVNGGTWVSPNIRGRLRVDVLFSNIVTFSLTNQSTTEFHLGGRTTGIGTNYASLFIDTNPNDTIQGTNLSTGSGGTGLHGSKIITSFWSEDE